MLLISGNFVIIVLMEYRMCEIYRLMDLWDPNLRGAIINLEATTMTASWNDPWPQVVTNPAQVLIIKFRGTGELERKIANFFSAIGITIMHFNHAMVIGEGDYDDSFSAYISLNENPIIMDNLNFLNRELLSGL